MATSRRRERELARRRFERRRQRELERRAKARRRNTITGAVVGVVAVLAVVAVLIVHFATGDSKKSNASVKPGSTPTAPASTPATTPPSSATPANPASGPSKCAKISPNPTAKGQPMIPPVNGKPPKKLVIKDVTKGKGRAAKAGDDLMVDYIGVSCTTGKVFDATYKDGNTPFEVKPLGRASVITGWNKGLVGMKPGGLRELIIPPDEGYGATGSGASIPGNDVLIFLIYAKSVKA